MTTLIDQDKTCFVCGSIGRYTEVGSTNRLGSPDLDTRPPEMMRSTMEYWMQCCPDCGYCAPHVEQGQVSAIELVKSQAYTTLIHDDSHPQLATRFLRWALIQEAGGKLVDAGWAAVRAAWACDDEGFNTAAEACRRRAVLLFDSAKENGESVADGEGVEEAILADLLRRSRQLDRVDAVCQAGLDKGPVEVVEKILRFQRELAAGEDQTCYTVTQLP